MIAVLREELIHYGELLCLLERQQKFIIAKSAEDLLQNAELMAAEIPFIAAARTARRQLTHELAEKLEQPRFTPLQRLLGLLPGQERERLAAFIHEINLMLRSCQKRVIENKLLVGSILKTPDNDWLSPPEPVCFGLN